MYQHIGKKLKVFAEIWCLLGVLGAIAAAVLQAAEPLAAEVLELHPGNIRPAEPEELLFPSLQEALHT